ncbi:hypothetical protein BH23PLA1_BH23PLA1_15540 [soil metagenome]
MSEAPPPKPGPRFRRRVVVDGLLAMALAVVALSSLLWTDADFGMVWDEGHTIRRERLLERWFVLVFDPPAGRSRWQAFTDQSLERHWPFSREEPDGHPPFYAQLGLLGWWVSHPYLRPLSAYRFGPMALSSLTVGFLYFHLARRQGRLAGLTASAALLLMPRIFAHARYAHYDMPVTCLWLLAMAAFVNALDRRAWILPFGVLMGLAAGTKLSGWFAPLAPMLWVLGMEVVPWLRRQIVKAEGADPIRFEGARALVLGGLVAGLTLFAIQPHWWYDPPGAVERFLLANTTRAETFPIPTLYLGQIYEFSLPWHNTIVLTAVAVPVLVQALGFLGIWACVSRGRSAPWMMIWPLSWSVLMVVRALPNAPGHDGLRQFLPAVASLAVLAGFGAAWLANRLRPRRLAWVAWLLAAGAIGESVVGIARVYPYTMSYYNVALGGLPGAERQGFEVTYYWDTMGPEFLAWVQDEAMRRPLQLRFPSDLINVPLLREWGELPREVPIVGIEPAADPDYVLQRRKGVYYPYDGWLERQGHPRFVIRRQGVDLLRVYSHAEALSAYEATKGEPPPPHLRRR